MMNDAQTAPDEASAIAIPQQTLLTLFLRFLRFGAFAWGGPIAQIAMIRQALVEDEHWVTSQHFNRVLGLYQVLPGPEAHELCVYFGMLARGRVGGLLAGLGFMLPGFILMFALSWAYLTLGWNMHGEFAVFFATIQAAVVALIVGAVHRIGSHVLLNGWLWWIGLLAFAGQLLGIHFGFLLASGGLAYFCAARNTLIGVIVLAICTAGIAAAPLYSEPSADLIVAASAPGEASLTTLFWSGLKAGALTFGGAYTAIPLLQSDAVTTGAWMTNAQFVDGIALSSLLPAPLIIFSTFVGYSGGGPLGALVMTTMTFFPAFALSLLAHEPLERLVREMHVRTFLDGLTAAVVGLIAATALTFSFSSITSTLTAVVFAVSLAVLFLFRSKFLIPCVIASAAVVGIAAYLF